MPQTMQEADIEAQRKVAFFLDQIAAVRESLHKVVVGQDDAIDLLLMCAITGNHELFTVDKDFEAIARHAPLKLFRGRAVRAKPDA